MTTLSMTQKTEPSLVDLTYLGLLKISGNDAKKLLQGQLTCHLDEVNNHQSRRAAHCNQKGRIISLFEVFYWHDSYYLLMPRETIPIALNALKKYAVFYQVTLEDVSDTWGILGYIGNELDKTFQTIPEKNHSVISHQDYIILKYPGNVSRYIIIAATQTIDTFRATLLLNTTMIDVNHWIYTDIMSHYAAIYPETSGIFLPHELQLPEQNAVSFSKGCYTGQEIIARMHYRGKLKSVLDVITLNHAPQRGRDLTEQQAMVIDYCCINNLFITLVLNTLKSSEPAS